MKLHVDGRQQDMAAPVVANAVFALTGRRLREMLFVLAS